MKVNKHIEKPAYILGVPVGEFFLVAILFIAMLVLSVLAGSFGFPYMKTLIAIGFFISWSLFLFVKWGNSKNYPGYILSIISFRFLQKRKINVKGYYIQIENKTP